MGTLRLIERKLLTTGETLERYAATLHRQTVHRLVWTRPRHGKPIMMDCIDYTHERHAVARFNRAKGEK